MDRRPDFIYRNTKPGYLVPADHIADLDVIRHLAEKMGCNNIKVSFEFRFDLDVTYVAVEGWIT